MTYGFLYSSEIGRKCALGGKHTFRFMNGIVKTLNKIVKKSILHRLFVPRIIIPQYNDKSVFIP